MTPESTHLFSALLAVLAVGIALAAVAPWLVRAWRAPVWGTLVPLRLPLAAAVAVTCTLGSLYFSEVANYQPCTLCWYQRILMYSSAIVLVIAAFRRDVGVRVYVIPLAGLGMAVSTYHFLVERYPDIFEKSDVCALGIPCAFNWFEAEGFRFSWISLPLMAFVGFATVVALLAMPQHFDTAGDVSGDPTRPKEALT